MVETTDSSNDSSQISGRKAYIIGGGIASLAAASFLIHDGGFRGENILALEVGDVFGGALDGTGSPELGYVIRGGRMWEDKAYQCTYELLSYIPSLSHPTKMVMDEVCEFNENIKTDSACRLLCAGEKLDVTKMGFSGKDRLALTELLASSEESLGAKRIEEFFDPAFFKTHFWSMWGTMFAFQPWHSLVEMKRYLHRFIHIFPSIGNLSVVRRTTYNQYDSVILPITTWLQAQGVHLLTGSTVTGLDFTRGQSGKAVNAIQYVRQGKSEVIPVEPDDLVFLTNGSMTAASTLGSMSAAALLKPQADDGAWSLWEALVKDNPEFGNPHAFNGDVDGSKWMSFTSTLRNPLFFELMENFTGNQPGTGGLVTFTDSNWLMSVVLPYQPHFLNQPDGVTVFWDYGLFIDQQGNYVDKKMSECIGEEIMTELLHHLRFDEHIPTIIDSTNCIPCMMPYITSQFMPRIKGDRPEVVPKGTSNLAFIGQYCEMPDEVVFTVEYSVRSAQTAVYTLLKVNKDIPPIYKGQYDVRVMFNAFKTMMT
jgi:oleate hydratase